MNIANNVVQSHFDGRRRLRPWRNTHYGGFDAVKAHPLSICSFWPDEGGTVSTSLNAKLAPVSGYMRSKAYCQVVQIFVPYQAIEKKELEGQADAGVTEMTRRRLLAGEGLGLEDEGEITKAANIHPRSIGGAKRVNKKARLAYLCAVEHLRKSAYHAALSVDRTETAILPALLTANVLDRFNGVLEPEKLIDGAINLTGSLPLSGIGRSATATAPDDLNISVKEADGSTVSYDKAAVTHSSGSNDGIVVRVGDNGEPEVFVDLDGTSEITLRDMVRSKKLDQIVREMARVVERDPVNGEELVERAIFGISVDYDHNCQVLYDNTFEIAPIHTRPVDGPSINKVSSHYEMNESFTTLVPRAELGGELVTLVSVKPIETLRKQPDPFQTRKFGLINRVTEELELEEQLLTRADLESDVDAQDEDQDAFWVGHNQLLHGYATQGPNEQQTQGVEMQSSMWVYEIPSSVTPENVSYPAEGIDMYPFHYWNGHEVEYTISQVAAVSTPLPKGPNPVERLQILADDPTLVDPDA